MPTKYKAIPVEQQKIDYGTAKSHYANVRFKQGLPKIAGGDIKKGTQAYNEIVLLQQTLKEKDFILLLAELADRSPDHWHMMAKYYEKRGFPVKMIGQVYEDAKAKYGESNKGPLDSISNLAIAGGGGGPIQEAPKPLPPPLVEAPKREKIYNSGFLNILKMAQRSKADRQVGEIMIVRNSVKPFYKTNDELKMGIILGVATPEQKAKASAIYKQYFGDLYFQAMPASQFRGSQQMKQFRFPKELLDY
jgi:hypothetical protein